MVLTAGGPDSGKSAEPGGGPPSPLAAGVRPAGRLSAGAATDTRGGAVACEISPS